MQRASETLLLHFELVCEEEELLSHKVSEKRVCAVPSWGDEGSCSLRFILTKPGAPHTWTPDKCDEEIINSNRCRKRSLDVRVLLAGTPFVGILQRTMNHFNMQ